MSEIRSYPAQSTVDDSDKFLLQDGITDATKYALLSDIRDQVLNLNSVPASALIGVRLSGRTTTSHDGGTPPAAATGQFYMQAGTTVGTFASSALDITFPAAFPNGLLTVVTANGDSIGTNPITVSAASTTKTGFRAQCASNGAQRVNWIAIGW